MVTRLLDRATVAGLLEALFDYEGNSGNQSIVESKNSEDDRLLP